MATLVFGALGTLLGGPIGGAIGALAGRQVDALILGGGNREGPRLKELAATASSYGTPLPRHFGRMRVPGTVIWATDLVERQQTQGGGKGRPSVTTYTYTASFAVALASRPILSVGRIWADGNLVRGAAGDLKAPGALRIYTGEGDQQPDPLIAAVEGAEMTPAWRGLAYAVFEDLELGDFFNRIPSLTFEVIADDGAFTVETLLLDAVAEADADLTLTGIDGYSCEGPLGETLALLDPLFPMDVDASGDRLVIARARPAATPIPLAEAAIAVGDGEFGAAAGYVRKRAPAPADPPHALRYYDIGRDYQPGVQRATGRPPPGQPRTIELPAALTAANARLLAERMASQAMWSRDMLQWRTCELDPAIGPGAIVSVPGQQGRWRVSEWEWRDKGVELALLRVQPAAIAAAAASAPPGADPGRTVPPVDLPPAPTVLAAFELPWDGAGTGDAATLDIAASSAGAGWSGAAILYDDGDGSLTPLGTATRQRTTMGAAIDALPAANPLLFDRQSTVTVELLATDMALSDATTRRLAGGVNRALIGNEIVQFGSAQPLGNRQWRLGNLLRGRGGTESAVAGHAPGERFVLLDGAPLVSVPAPPDIGAEARVVALGRGDAVAVEMPVALAGIGRRPLSPVHPRAESLGDGSFKLGWTRRARGALAWLGGVDAPLHEEQEAYVVTFGPLGAPQAQWEVSEPWLTIAPALLANLVAAAPGEAFRVRQRGTYALSEPLVLAIPA
jgi:hypothetical protein